jgi:uncharacterized NAD(P)/FAD-binding protein YdhS
LGNRKKLVVIGCGASAVILLAELCSSTSGSAFENVDVIIFDDNPDQPSGLAYAIDHPSFVLNVPAIKMGAQLANQADFYTWLQKNQSVWSKFHPEFENLHYDENDFVPRMLYAEYLKSVFAQTKTQLQARGVGIFERRERVESIDSAGEQVIIVAGGENVIADAVVFCSGHGGQNKFNSTELDCNLSPFTQAGLEDDWSDYRHLVIVGSGLSMVDFIQYGEAKGFSGKYHVFSRSGLLPLAHETSHCQQKLPELKINPENLSCAALLKRLRNYVADNQRLGINWQDSLHCIREKSNQIFAAVSPANKKRLSKLMPWWNIHRHRIPVEAHQRLMQLQNNERLQIYRGTLLAVKQEQSGCSLLVNSVNSSSARVIEIAADKFINCSGRTPGFHKVAKMAGTLLYSIEELNRLLVQGDSNFKMAPQHEIYAIGPALSGVLFETSAIHEIRQQANRVAFTLNHIFTCKGNH